MGLKRFIAALLVTVALISVIVMIPMTGSAKTKPTTTETTSSQQTDNEENQSTAKIQDSTPLDRYDAPKRNTETLAIGLVSFAVISGAIVVFNTLRESKKYNGDTE